MPIQILMPALSPTMTEGTLAKWLKQAGEAVAAGDLIAEIETDKATMEIEAVEEGVMGKHLVAEGTEGVPVNTPIAILLEEDEDAAALEDSATLGGAAPGGAGPGDTAPVAPPPAAAEPTAAPVPTAPAPAPAAEPEWAGPSVTLTVREALRDAMAEEAQLKEIDREVKEVVSEAADFAQESPEPDAAELYTDVLA